MIFKKTIVGIIVLLFVLISLAMLIYIIAKNSKFNSEAIYTLPVFSFTNAQNQVIFTNDSLSTGQANLIIYYNSECEHCQREAEQISKRIHQFDTFHVLMISYESRETILAFRETYKLISPTFIFLQDSEYQFDDIFGKSPIPSSFIYNKKGELVKQFKGEVKAETLIKYLAQ